jgi:toxin-antitoxin system PIN domain toxin
MTLYLLDVNVVVSLIIRTHSHYPKASDWFLSEGQDNWCTCPIVENGALRVSLNTLIDGAPLPASLIVGAIDNLKSRGQHVFLPDDISILDITVFDHDLIATKNQITDTYVLALAAKHDAVLATFDRKLATGAVRLSNAKVRLLT